MRHVDKRAGIDEDCGPIGLAKTEAAPCGRGVGHAEHHEIVAPFGLVEHASWAVSSPPGSSNATVRIVELNSPTTPLRTSAKWDVAAATNTTTVGVANRTRLKPR